MSMHPTFRSHLMQQFAAAASRQSRPPLVLAQLSSSGGSGSSGGPSRSGRRVRSSTSASHPASASHRRSSTSTSTSSAGAGAASFDRTVVGSRRSDAAPPPPPPTAMATRVSLRSFAESTSLSEVDSSEALDDRAAAAAESLQSLIRSRRTVSNFIPAASPSSESADAADRIRSALTRAVLCALSAPNHHRTEPFTFRRLLSPSDATDRLADIAYRVSVRRMRERARGSERSIQAEAERKREKWRGVPAFLVATVGGQPNQRRRRGSEAAGGDDDGAAVSADIGGDRNDDEEEEDDDDDNDGAAQYAELPLAPPETERQLEDYASACAAVQNVLLSLHSEGVGSKWATGPVVRTGAFRDLVGCREDEAVVGLVMAGTPKGRAPREPRRRREIGGDVLRDL